MEELTACVPGESSPPGLQMAPFLCPHLEDRQEALVSLLVRVLTWAQGPHPHLIISPSEAPPLKTIILGVRASAHEFWGDKHILSSVHDSEYIS